MTENSLTQKRLKIFISMAKTQASLDDIAHELGLARSGIIYWGKSHGADYWKISGLVTKNRSKKPKNSNQKKRKCLSCQKDFRSWGPGNRLCQTCKNTESDFNGDSHIANTFGENLL